MIEGTEMEKDDCTTIVLKAHKAGNQPLFNNAAQVIIGMLQLTVKVEQYSHMVLSQC